jgi:2-amino-4-hydroxy-6-hydroxymethyldihydropteridine diphosphokinase
MITAYISLGSNLNNPEQQIRTALVELNNIANTQLIKSSSLYRNPPLGNISQPAFINAVAELHTELTPENLFAELQKLELQHGRIRPSKQWSEARPLDLDILLYGDKKIASEHLTIPHYALMERNFYLFPLFEIAPELQFPGDGFLRDVIKSHRDDNLYKIS